MGLGTTLQYLSVRDKVISTTKNYLYNSTMFLSMCCPCVQMYTYYIHPTFERSRPRYYRPSQLQMTLPYLFGDVGFFLVLVCSHCWVVGIIPISSSSSSLFVAGFAQWRFLHEVIVLLRLSLEFCKVLVSCCVLQFHLRPSPHQLKDPDLKASASPMGGVMKVKGHPQRGHVHTPHTPHQQGL